MDDAPADGGELICRMTRDGHAVVRDVDAVITTLLGWAPDDLIGRPSTSFIHPDDYGDAVAAWLRMIDDLGSPSHQTTRYRTIDGTWVGIAMTNVARRDADGSIVVSTELRRSGTKTVDVEEALRSRTEVLERLADVIPIGLVQFDLSGGIVFANKALESILSLPEQPRVDALLTAIDGPSRSRLHVAVDAMMRDEPVDDLELQIQTDDGPRHLSVGLRALTDTAGRVSGGIACLSDVTDSVRRRRELERKASTDQLTGLLRRDVVLRALQEPTTDHVGTALIFLDVDRFKHVNDHYGHEIGDLLLIALARRLEAAARPKDLIARFGGDEFVILCPQVSAEADARLLADRFGQSVNHPLAIEGYQLELQTSLGVAWTSLADERPALVGLADERMFEVKRCRAADRR